MKLKEARALVRDTELEDLFGDYGEFVTHYVPAVKTLKKSRLHKDLDLAAFGCHQIADVWWMAGAPKRSITFYQQSFRLYPTPYPITELARRYVEIGKPVEAEKTARKAHRQYPQDELVRSMIYDLSEGKVAAEFRGGDPVWESSELLAKGKPKAALKALKGARGMQARLKRAAILGILGEYDKAIRQWRKLSKLKGDVFIGVDDWFYMSEGVFDHPDFWLAMKKLLPKLGRSTFVHVDGVEEVVGEGHEEAKKQLVVEYHLCRTTGDLETAAALAQQFPQWREIKALALRLMASSAS